MSYLSIKDEKENEVLFNKLNFAQHSNTKLQVPMTYPSMAVLSQAIKVSGHAITVSSHVIMLFMTA